MATVLALELLYDAVVALAAADYAPDPPPVGFFFGVREAGMQINEFALSGASRIVLMPGDESGAGGVDGPPRPLATEEEVFTWYLWAVDPDLANERKQYTAARLLFDAWRRWIYLATHTDGDTGIGPVTLGRWRWNRSNVERVYGAEIIVSGSISAAVFDESPTLVTDMAGAIASVDELGQTDVINT